MHRSKRRSLTARQSAFLAVYAQIGWVTRAAEAIGITRQAHYLWLKTKPAYAEAFRRTDRDLCDNLLGLAIQKALVGVPEPVTYKGKLCYEPLRDAETGAIIRNPETGDPISSDKPMVIYRQSTPLHLLVLKIKLPELFGEKTRTRWPRK